MCPVSLAEKMKGTFTLDELKPTPLFTRYNVANVSWVVVDHSGKVVHTIKGHGIYQVGGEVALMQQLILDLSIDGANLEVFDSGLVPVESPFPSISISVDHDAKCFEIRLDIKADPK